jgi:hypothetical protein
MSKLKIAEELFKGRHFDRGIVILCVRWYLRFKLSLRDLVEQPGYCRVVIGSIPTTTAAEEGLARVRTGAPI